MDLDGIVEAISGPLCTAIIWLCRQHNRQQEYFVQRVGHQHSNIEQDWRKNTSSMNCSTDYGYIWNGGIFITTSTYVISAIIYVSYSSYTLFVSYHNLLYAIFQYFQRVFLLIYCTIQCAFIICWWQTVGNSRDTQHIKYTRRRYVIFVFFNIKLKFFTLNNKSSNMSV